MYSYLFLSFIFILVDNSQEHLIKKPIEISYLTFAQQWPPSVCIGRKPNQCTVPGYVTSWTVHGIWPESRHSYPSFCNDSWKFNVTELKTIESELDVVWPNLFPDKSIFSFWKHEWQKHGTCVISIPKIDSELKYFTMAISLHNLYNIKKLLQNGGIFSDESTLYTIEDFHNVVEDQIGKKVGFECKKLKNGYSVIFTSFICLDKNLTLINCINKDRNCNGTQIIYLPMKNSEFMIVSYKSQSVTFATTFWYICLAVSGIVLVLILIVTIALIFSFRKHKTNKLIEVYKVPPPIIEHKVKI